MWIALKSSAQISPVNFTSTGLFDELAADLAMILVSVGVLFLTVIVFTLAQICKSSEKREARSSATEAVRVISNSQTHLFLCDGADGRYCLLLIMNIKTWLIEAP